MIPFNVAICLNPNRLMAEIEFANIMNLNDETLRAIYKMIKNVEFHPFTNKRTKDTVSVREGAKVPLISSQKTKFFCKFKLVLTIVLGFLTVDESF